MELGVVESFVEGLTASGFVSFGSNVLNIACYVLTAIALYAMAKRRGIQRPWLAWVPVVNVYLLGCIADQYRYVAKGENRSKRKALLTLNIIVCVLVLAIVVIAVVMVSNILMAEFGNASNVDLEMTTVGYALGIVVLALVFVGVEIALQIVRFIALYDVYNSCDPENSTLFLVLSIILPVTEAFFLFFSREKDIGMPPRKATMAYQELPQQPVREPWEQKNEE